MSGTEWWCGILTPVINSSSTPIRRHRNPLGIVARVFVFPWMGLALWRHQRWPLAVGAVVETVLWTLVPPVEAGPAPVEAAIEVELAWLNAPLDAMKTLSWGVLGAFPVLIGTGLWKHSPRLLVAGSTSGVMFGLLMQRVARVATAKPHGSNWPTTGDGQRTRPEPPRDR